MWVDEAFDKLRPVLFVEGFTDPALEGAKDVFGYTGKEEV